MDTQDQAAIPAAKLTRHAQLFVPNHIDFAEKPLARVREASPEKREREG